MKLLKNEFNISNENFINYQTKESKNMYSILNQALFKDVLENYKI